MDFDCPHCGERLSHDSPKRERLECPYCQGTFESLGIAVTNTPSLPVINPRGARGRRFPGPLDQYRRRTDPFAIVAFMSGILGLALLPIVFGPICWISTAVSGYRLNEDRSLKGRGLQICGGICGILQMLYLFWIFGLFEQFYRR